MLFYNFYDYVKKQQPKVFIIENVKGLLSDAEGKTFQNWLDLLGASVNNQHVMFPHEDSLEYNLHWTVLNSKDFGVPQNRERVFIVGIRKDLPNTFRFPIGFPLNIRLKDILEPVVDEKYYLSDKMLAGFLSHNENHLQKGNGFKFQPKTGEEQTASCVTARVFKMGVDDNYIKEPLILRWQNKDAGVVQDEIAPTLRASGGTDIRKRPYVLEPICVRMQGRDPNNLSNRNTKGIKTEQVLEPNSQGITNTITSVSKDNLILSQKIIGYTRDEKGCVTSRHLKDISGVNHTSSGSGGNTDQFTLEATP